MKQIIITMLRIISGQSLFRKATSPSCQPLQQRTDSSYLDPIKQVSLSPHPSAHKWLGTWLDWFGYFWRTYNNRQPDRPHCSVCSNRQTDHTTPSVATDRQSILLRLIQQTDRPHCSVCGNRQTDHTTPSVATDRQTTLLHLWQQPNRPPSNGPVHILSNRGPHWMTDWLIDYLTWSQLTCTVSLLWSTPTITIYYYYSAGCPSKQQP